jgi:hypothetical protein
VICAACGFREQERINDEKHPCFYCEDFARKALGSEPHYCKFEHRYFFYGPPDGCEHFREKDFRKFEEITTGGVSLYACPKCGTVRINEDREDVT